MPGVAELDEEAACRKWLENRSSLRVAAARGRGNQLRGPVDLIGLLRFDFRLAFSSLTTTTSEPSRLRHAAIKLCDVERVMSVRAIGPSNLPYFGIRGINFNDL